MKYNLSNLILPSTIITEQAAIAAHSLMGMGDEKGADQLAVSAMRSELNKLPINGTVVIGEGERDEAPMLYIGESVGLGNGVAVDIAVDPLEGTTILATGNNNALAVIAIAEAGSLLNAPDVYMEKIAIGFDYPEQIIDLDNSPKANLQNIAKAKKCSVSDLLTIILDRPRHEELIAKVREAGARVQLIKDGDIAAVISTIAQSGITSANADLYIGTGGAPEGVLAASALSVCGGQMCGRLVFRNNEEKLRAEKIGIKDLSRQYSIGDMVKGEVIFAATGVTDGYMLSGVRVHNRIIETESIIMHSGTKTIRKIKNISLV